MALAAIPGPLSIQRLLAPLFHADRTLQSLQHTQYEMIDLEDNLEDLGLHAAIPALHNVVRHLRLLITQVQIRKLELMCQLVRALHLHHRHHGRVPAVDLELPFV